MSLTLETLAERARQGDKPAHYYLLHCVLREREQQHDLPTDDALIAHLRAALDSKAARRSIRGVEIALYCERLALDGLPRHAEPGGIYALAATAFNCAATTAAEWHRRYAGKAAQIRINNPGGGDYHE